MGPVGLVVARPDGAPALRPRERGAREDEGPRAVGGAQLLAQEGGPVQLAAVLVVQLAVLDAAEVKRVLRERHLGPVEHGRLVHVVPCERVQRGALVPGTNERRRE